MKLFFMPGASSLAGHIVLEWVGQAYETVQLNRQTIRHAQYLALNPSGTVPLLVDGDLVLSENVAILAYLADLHPAHCLLGDGSPRHRAEVMRWLGFLNSDVHKAFRPIFAPEQYLPEAAMAQTLASTARGHVRHYLARLDAQLEGRDWLTGERSVADAYLFVLLRWAIGTKIGLQGLANLAGFARRLHADSGVHAALVAEEGLALRNELPTDPSSILTRLQADIDKGLAIVLNAEVVGPVEYREGDGMAFELRRGLVEISFIRTDAVVSWTDENFHGEAAMPFDNMVRYIHDGSVRLRV